MVLRTLAELQKECDSLGITNVKPTGRGGKHSKQDYINALADYNLIKRYGSVDKTPKYLQYRLSMQSPMLAYQFTNLKPAEQEKLFTSPDWVFTEKINGNRMILIYSPKTGLHLYSRNISVQDYLPVDYSDKLLETIPAGKLDFSFVIDTEITSTNPNVKTFLRNTKGVETATDLQAITAIMSLNTEDSLEVQRNQRLNPDTPLLKFNLIDVLFYGKDYRKVPYGERTKVYDEVVSKLQSGGLHIERIKYCNDPAHKKQFLDGILASGGEGVVASNLNKTYNDTVNRQRDEWVKIKRSVSDTLKAEGLGDSIDGWISGFKLANDDKGFSGLIGALYVSVFLQKSDGTEVEHVIASVPNIPLTMRKEMSGVDELGNTILKPEWYNRVVEVEGQAISAREKRLSHPKLVRWRDDKSKFECMLSEEFLEANIL